MIYIEHMPDDQLTEALYLRISAEDRALLKSLGAKLPMKEATIARSALRIGLAELDRDPSRIVLRPAKPARRKR